MAAEVARPAAPPRPAPARSRRARPWLKPGIFLGGLMPLVSLILRGTQGQLGADPIAIVENETGLVALIFLIAALACTPLRYVFGWTWQIAVRRQLGLFAFWYAVIHMLIYTVLDQVLDWRVILEDIVQRPFLTAGMAAVVLMTPLAITSTNAWVRKLGYHRWQLLHRLAYVAGVLGIIHFFMRQKIDVSQPLMYGAVLVILLGVRAAVWFRKRRLEGAAMVPTTP